MNQVLVLVASLDNPEVSSMVESLSSVSRNRLSALQNYLLGMSATKRGQWAEALPRLHAATWLRPSSSQILYAFSTTADRVGKRELAEATVSALTR